MVGNIKMIRGFVRPIEDDSELQKRVALPIRMPWQKKIELQPLPMGTTKLMSGGKHRRMR
jgi:hypothetical protein